MNGKQQETSETTFQTEEVQEPSNSPEPTFTMWNQAQQVLPY